MWKRLTDAGLFIVVAPGSGFGHWGHAGGVEALRVGPRRVALDDLSNGGHDVMRAVEADVGLASRR
ncbi:MAG: hypothetical protein INH41_14160 [Myxococcaceae bacterium]|nr:hypothetical protein [Myxococcaceae bacterium]MCA3013522.1 hypothetical protein [Myxococcaceae bacterium]